MGAEESRDDRRVRFEDDDDYGSDYDDRRRNRPRRDSIDSYDSYDDRNPRRSPRPREGTGTSLGKQIQSRARQAEEPPPPPRSPRNRRQPSPQRDRSPTPRLPSPPTRRRSPPPTPPRFDTPPRNNRSPPRSPTGYRYSPSPPNTPPRQHQPPPPNTVVYGHSRSRRPVNGDVEYVPSALDPGSPRRGNAPMTPIHEGPVNGRRSRTPTPEIHRHNPGWERVVHTVRTNTNSDVGSDRSSRQRRHVEKPQMSNELWGADPNEQMEPEQPETPMINHIHQETDHRQIPGDYHARNEYGSQVQLSHQEILRKRTKLTRRGSDGPELTQQKKLFHQQVLGDFYEAPKVKNWLTPRKKLLQDRQTDDTSGALDTGSIASEGGRRRSVRAVHNQNNPVVNPEAGDVNAYQLLSHGFAPTHSYFNQNVAVTTIKSPRRAKANSDVL